LRPVEVDGGRQQEDDRHEVARDTIGKEHDRRLTHRAVLDLSKDSSHATRLTRFFDAVHPGVVVNCAGATRGGARELTRHNTVAVATVCEALRRSGCGARLVQVGCGAEYGPSQPGSSTAEDAVPRPGGPYGVSKLAATELVLGSGLDAVVLRVFSPAGPGTPAGSPLGRLAEAMRRAMQSGDGDLKLGGLGVQRDFVDVRDVARAVHAASLSAAQGVINIGSAATEINVPTSAIYTATKGALDSITGVLAKELGPKKIRVNSINPGMIETEGVHAAGFIHHDTAHGDRASGRVAAL